MPNDNVTKLIQPGFSRVCATVRPLRRTPVASASRPILPPYARRPRSLEMLMPILYLKGISTATRRVGALLRRQPGDNLVGLAEAESSRFRQRACSSIQTSLSRAMVEADRPGPSLPSNRAVHGPDPEVELAWT